MRWACIRPSDSARSGANFAEAASGLRSLQAAVDGSNRPRDVEGSDGPQALWGVAGFSSLAAGGGESAVETRQSIVWVRVPMTAIADEPRRRMAFRTGTLFSTEP